MLNEYDAFNLVGVIQTLCFIGFGVYMWFSKRETAKASELETLKEKVLGLELEIKHMPDQKQVNDLIGDMKGVKAELKAISDAMKPIHRSLNRIDNYLLQSKE